MKPFLEDRTEADAREPQALPTPPRILQVVPAQPGWHLAWRDDAFELWVEPIAAWVHVEREGDRWPAIEPWIANGDTLSPAWTDEDEPATILPPGRRARLDSKGRVVVEEAET